MRETKLLPRARWLRAGWIALLGTTIAASLTAAPWRLRQLSARSPGRADASMLASDGLRPAERAFLERAAELSRMQLQLAQLGLGQARGSEVRAFAQQLTGDVRQVSDAVDALVRRKGETAVTSPSPTGEPMPQAFQRLLERTGGDFDREFMRMMGETIENVSALFERAMSDVKDSDVRDLAASHLPVLREHRNRAIELKAAVE